MTAGTIAFRPGTLEDSRAVFDVFFDSLKDLRSRHGLGEIPGENEPDAVDKLWLERRSLFEHMAHNAAAWWIAEEDGHAVGYARTFHRDGLWELTEFFVRPGVQTKGIGRELLARVLPGEESGAERRLIMATMDPRALTRYFKIGVRPQMVAFYFARPAVAQVEPVTNSELTLVPLGASPDSAQLDALAVVDRAVLGIRRDADHSWLAAGREGFVARRAGRVVGYGYAGSRSGPFAALDPADQPALFMHAENRIAALDGGGDFGLSIPALNRVATDYVLARGFRLDPFVVHFLSDEPFGRFDGYTFTTPTFFL